MKAFYHIIEQVQNYFINHKEEYLTIFGLFSGTASFIKSTTPFLQYILLVLSVVSVGISVYMKVKKHFDKKK